MLRRETAAGSVESRFWAKVARVESDACWLWQASFTGPGYGQFAVAHAVFILAHRAAWQFATGDTLVHDDVIGHICDTTGCVRNDDEGVYEVRGVLLPRRGHLFKGTHADNIQDKLAKGRQGLVGARGVLNGRAKLTEIDVRAIRERYTAGGCTLRGLAAEYGVGKSLVSLIVRGESWRDLLQH